MKLRLAICACVLGAFAGFGASAAAARTLGPMPPHLAAAELLGYGTGFQLQGANGYRIGVYGFSERRDGRGQMYVEAIRRDGYTSVASYLAPAIVSDHFFKADLGAFGRVDLELHLSGEKRKIDIKCSRRSYQFEPGVFEGTLEFEGEKGYTSVSATRIPLPPPATSFCGEDGGYSESSGSGLPGARLEGISYAHGRQLDFKVNKNHRHRGRVPFTAELRERRGKIKIYRGIGGVAPADSFHFDRDLSSASLHLPIPFSGSATLRRRPNSVSPRWTGDLSADFPGRPNVRLAGPTVHVSLAPACLIRGSGGYADAC